LQLDANQATDINLLIRKLLEKDFRTIIPEAKDSATVNASLKILEKQVEARNDSAILIGGMAIVLADQAGLVPKISIALQDLGKYYMAKENFTEATNSFISALRIEEKRNDEKRIADLCSELNRVYFFQEIFPKSLDYGERALAIYQKRKDTGNISVSLSQLGSLYVSREYCEHRTDEQRHSDQITALDYYQKSIALAEKKGLLDQVASVNSNIGMVYYHMNQAETAIGYVQKALTYYRENKKMPEVSNTLYDLGYIYDKLKKYDLALNCLNESKEIGLREKSTDGIQFLYQAIAQTYDHQKDYKNSLAYYIKYMTLRDSIYNNEKSKQIFELETQYQTEKKQAEIERLTLVKRHKTLAIYILIASLILVSMLSYYFFRNIRNKKIIAEQELILKETQILELEKDRQLSAAKSVLQGEEAERSRLAGDLHDGLGGLLTGVKLKLSSMKENAIITNENLTHFNHALDLLDTSINELRRVAHNLMPETLIHYGLRTALNDFIKQVSPEGLPLIRFNTFGEDLRYEKELEITIYRIAQELATNAIKHAHAKQIDIQLFTEKERVCVQVTDNGIGFEPERPEPVSNGNGLKNIHDRVTAFNGRFEILSQPGKGTECTVEFFVS
jgi:signal transduction histidine kinase